MIKRHKSLFRWYRLKNEPTENPDDTYTLYFDGSTSAKTGVLTSATAIVLYKGKERILGQGVYLGGCKSNAAEFSGLLYGMRLALERGVRKLRVIGDSEVFFKITYRS
jgi:ribonuclease HI